MFQKPSPHIALAQEDYSYASPDEVETVVGPSVQVEGDFSSEGNIVVKGTVSGSVKTSKLLTVENGAKILANVKASDAIVAGQVRGNIVVTNRIEFSETAQVFGDIQCQILVVAPGAVLQGKVNMRGGEEEDRADRKAKASVRSKTKIVEGQGQEIVEE